MLIHFAFITLHIKSLVLLSCWISLTHWGRVTHICVSDLTSIGSDNGLSPGRRQAIIRTNAGILLLTPLGTNFSEFLVEILIFSFKKMRFKVSSAKRRPFCPALKELMSAQPGAVSPMVMMLDMLSQSCCWIPLRNLCKFRQVVP